MSSGFKIERVGDIVFVTAPGIGNAFNVKLVSRVLVETFYSIDIDKLYVSIWAGSPQPVTISEVSPAELQQMFMDTPWVRVIPRSS